MAELIEGAMESNEKASFEVNEFVHVCKTDRSEENLYW
jgi:hypothetical protein